MVALRGRCRVGKSRPVEVLCERAEAEAFANAVRWSDLPGEGTVRRGRRLVIVFHQLASGLSDDRASIVGMSPSTLEGGREHVRRDGGDGVVQHGPCTCTIRLNLSPQADRHVPGLIPSGVRCPWSTDMMAS